jgi:hypothetical protein
MSDFLDLHEDATVRRVLYLGAILLLVVPFVQAGSQLWPVQFSNIQWRFGAANAFSAVLLLPFLGITLLLVIGRALESRAVSRTASVLALLFTVGLAASFVVFVLDALQLKTIVSTQMEGAFRATAARVGIVTSLFIFAFAFLTVAGFKAPRSSAYRNAPAPRKSASPRQRETEESGDDSAPGLIVGR